MRSNSQHVGEIAASVGKKTKIIENVVTWQHWLRCGWEQTAYWVADARLSVRLSVTTAPWVAAHQALVSDLAKKAAEIVKAANGESG